MAPNDTRAWMWAEACELLDRAEWLNRQFFQPKRQAVWEPPVDLFETDRALWVVVALPGDGPLVHRLEELGAEVVRCRMPVLRKTILRPAGLLGFLRDVVLGWLPAWRLVPEAAIFTRSRRCMPAPSSPLPGSKTASRAAVSRGCTVSRTPCGC